VSFGSILGPALTAEPLLASWVRWPEHLDSNMSNELEDAAEYVAEKVASRTDPRPPVYKPMNTDVFRIYVRMVVAAMTLMFLSLVQCSGFGAAFIGDRGC
jgi:hypothetical protein